MVWSQIKSSNKAKKNMEKTNRNALLPCNRILAIKELRDLICSYLLSSRNFFYHGRCIILRALLVCRHWRSYLTPYFMQDFTLDPDKNPSRIFSNIIKPHGHLIRRFSCRAVNSTILERLAEHCLLLEEVKFGFGKEALWIGYDDLERLWGTLSQARFQMEGRHHGQGENKSGWQNHGSLTTSTSTTIPTVGLLKKVEIHIDVLEVKPSMLWSLCHAPYITDVSIEVCGMIGQEGSKAYVEDLTIFLLECCSPRVERLHIYYSPQRYLYHVFGGYRSWFKERVLETKGRKGRAPPVEPQEALVRLCRAISSGIREVEDDEEDEDGKRKGSKSSVAATMNSKPEAGAASTAGVTETSSTFGLRRLELTGQYAELDILPSLFQRSPLLQELTISQAWSKFNSSHWLALLTQCRYTLRAIRMHGDTYSFQESDIPPVPDLLKCFQKLELLHVVQYPHKELDLVLLESNLTRFELDHDHPHPLKALCIVGNFDKPLFKLFTILSCSSLKRLETLKVGHAHMLQPQYNAAARDETPDTSEEGLCYDFTPSWGSVAATLVRLDLDGLVFPDKRVTERFFRRLEGFGCLRVLRISIHHAQDLNSISTASSCLSSTTTTSRENDKESCTLGITLPTVDFCFPHLQDLLITNHRLSKMMYGSSSSWNSNGDSGAYPFRRDRLILEEVLFLIAATISSLRNLLLSSQTLEEAIAAVVRGQFRSIYVNTAYEDYLPWFDAKK